LTVPSIAAPIADFIGSADAAMVLRFAFADATVAQYPM